MERNEIIILGALAAAFFILRPRAAPAAGTGAAAAPAGSTGAAPSNSTKPPTNGVGGYGSGEIGAHTITPEWILNSAGMGSGNRAPATSPNASPVQDPVAAAGPSTVFTPMPKQPVYFDFA